jgi:phosphatidylglycerol:prolipoprotein diacylglycerol transferase
MIAVGFLVFLWLTYRHPKRIELIGGEQYLNALFIGLVSGVVGGRLLYIATDLKYFLANPLDMLAPWQGGFVVLGSIIGVLIVVPLYLHRLRVKILPLLDLASLYAPLMQAIARFGCLFAGCCYGEVAHNLPWAITFTDPNGFAPLHFPLHPTQMYLALASFCIFILINLFARIVTTQAGQLSFIFLILESLSRFTLDFWRGDRGPLFEFSLGSHARFLLSEMQCYSATFFALCLVGLIIVSWKKSQQST